MAKSANLAVNNNEEIIMGKGMNQKKEVKKPKKEKPKASPAALRGK
ncbi:MAG: hypothetical protein WCD79_22905 [Chthoniobacteraceae bacterium]